MMPRVYRLAVTPADAKSALNANEHRGPITPHLWIVFVVLLSAVGGSVPLALVAAPKYDVIVRTRQLDESRYGGKFVADVVTAATRDSDLLMIAREITQGALIHCPYGLARTGDVRFFSSRQRTLLRSGTESNLNEMVTSVAVVSWYQRLGGKRGEPGIVVGVRRPPKFTARPLEYEPLSVGVHKESCR
jgi:hypothetical protein